LLGLYKLYMVCDTQVRIFGRWSWQEFTRSGLVAIKPKRILDPIATEADHWANQNAMQMQCKSTSVKAVKARELTLTHVRKSRAMQMQCKSTSVKAVQGLWATTHKARYRKTWANQVISFRSEARTVQAKMNWGGLSFYLIRWVPTTFLKPQRCSNQHFIKIITVFHNSNLETWLNEDSVCSFLG